MGKKYRLKYELKKYLDRKAKLNELLYPSEKGKKIPINSGKPVKGFGSYYNDRDYWKYLPPVIRPRMKYVAFADGSASIFPDTIIHIEIIECNFSSKPVGAGFIKFSVKGQDNPLGIKCSGMSSSTGIKSRKVVDEKQICDFLQGKGKFYEPKPAYVSKLPDYSKTYPNRMLLSAPVTNINGKSDFPELGVKGEKKEWWQRGKYETDEEWFGAYD